VLSARQRGYHVINVGLSRYMRYKPTSVADAPVKSRAVEELTASLGEISDLGRARALLAWDERTQMPPGGAEARSEQLATLTRLRHDRLRSDELGRLLERAEAGLDGAQHDSFEASLARVTRREWEKARCVPTELRAEIARATSLSERAWEDARERSDFGAFLPHLERVIELKRRYIECFDPQHPYDALLDDYEPGMTLAEVRPVLARLAAGTRDLLSEIVASGVELDDSPLYGEFPVELQRDLAREVLALLPLDPDEVRLDATVHPFVTPIAIADQRVTTRYDPSYIGTALWSVIHEAGHAIYHNGYARDLERTLLCASVSLGFDESQSRLWENWVGRGRPFLGRLLPLLTDRFPERFGGLDTEAIYRAANRVRPSLIRVEADEVTYNLHVALRFELEVELFEERLAPAELAEAWRERTREHLGLELPGDSRGVLQDVHWSAGAFGYFPTYSLGNVIAASIWETARGALPNLDEQLAAGELVPLRDHLRERLYRHGAKRLPTEMVEKLTGGPLDPEPLLAHLRRKYGALYGFAG
jgi:carboxypeptidase Taq